jgi:hypothetical protein
MDVGPGRSLEAHGDPGFIEQYRLYRERPQRREREIGAVLSEVWQEYLSGGSRTRARRP